MRIAVPVAKKSTFWRGRPDVGAWNALLLQGVQSPRVNELGRKELVGERRAATYLGEGIAAP